jgi:sigma-B regulation protein RsbU (phosphoserine phosphatase)
MHTALADSLRDQLLDRRQRLESAMSRAGEASDLVRLLHDVDSALGRLDGHTLGICELCGEGITTEWLHAHPLTQYCLCTLSPEQQTALQDDLDLAWRIQSALLPDENLAWAGWETHYRYLPAGPVSGDYVDLLPCETDGCNLFFALGDVSGKGVAASFLMAHLNALFRTLNATDMPLQRVVERANSIFSDSTTTSHYATLVCGWASSTGEVTLANAGHVLPLLARGGQVTPIDSTGLPVGIFGDSAYELQRFRLEPGDTLFLYSDGLSESTDASGAEYGEEGIARLLAASHALPPPELAAAVLDDAARFRGETPATDDLTILVLRRIV